MTALDESFSHVWGGWAHRHCYLVLFSGRKREAGWPYSHEATEMPALVVGASRNLFGHGLDVRVNGIRILICRCKRQTGV